jgi:hypothetical protein
VITVDEIRAALAYDSETGVLTWKPGRHLAGKAAGYVSTGGYRLISVGQKEIQAHRLAWAIQTGAFPEGPMDHINGDRLDNRWANLRAATFRQNAQNRRIRSDNTTGAKGVSFNRTTGRYRAYIYVKGRQVVLGHFDTVEAASEAYAQGAHKHFGAFARVA